MPTNNDLSETQQDDSARRKPMTYDDIRDLCHTMDKNDALYPKVHCVWIAMTDLGNIPTRTAFLKILHKEVKNDLTKDNLGRHLKGFKGQYGMPGIAWKAEAIAGAIQLFAYYPDAQTLEDVFLVFEEEIRARI